jgi:hypothetical protein
MGVSPRLQIALAIRLTLLEKEITAIWPHRQWRRAGRQRPCAIQSAFVHGQGRGTVHSGMPAASACATSTATDGMHGDASVRFVDGREQGCDPTPAARSSCSVQVNPGLRSSTGPSATLISFLTSVPLFQAASIPPQH